MTKYFTYLIILSFFIFSCSKEKDESPPEIVVSQPANGQQFNSIDTVQLVFSVSDNENVKSIRVSLRNSNDDIVAQTISRAPNTKTFQFNEPYTINNIHLQSGAYYFDISASDGDNTSHKFIHVNLNSIPKTRQGIFISSYNGSSSDVYLMDNSFQTSYYKNFSGDVLGIVVNSFDQQLIHSCYTLGSLTAIDLFNGSPLWSIAAQSSPPTPFFTSLMKGSDNKIYTGYRDGRFKALNTSGAASINGWANTNFYIEESALFGDFYVTEQQSIPVGQSKIVLHWKASGAQHQQAWVNEDIIGIYQKNNNEYILLTNNSSNVGNVLFYYLSTGLTGSPFGVSIGKIEDAVEISSGLYLVAEGNNLTYINTNNFTTLNYLTGVTANLLRYDSFNDELFVVSGNQITIYDYTTKAVKSIYVHPTTIVDLDFWYNK